MACTMPAATQSATATPSDSPITLLTVLDSRRSARTSAVNGMPFHVVEEMKVALSRNGSAGMRELLGGGDPHFSAHLDQFQRTSAVEGIREDEHGDEWDEISFGSLAAEEADPVILLLPRGHRQVRHGERANV